MPGSFPVFDGVVAHLMQRLQPRRLLDVGAGAGKYGRMLRGCAPGAWSQALEIDAGLIARHGLAEVYSRVEVVDATHWWQQDMASTFDLVVLGDCLQQMPKSAGLDLLNALVYRSAWIVVVLPEFVVPQGEGPAPTTMHRSVWSERDLHWHDLWAWDHVRATTLAVLRGYLPSPTLSMAQWHVELQAAHVMLQHFDGQTPVRPARLRLEQVPREVEYRLA
ncbi:MAG: hypothetical protein RL223_1673 [Pseudomonadota bacterium]|jgi:hypothetical protein